MDNTEWIFLSFPLLRPLSFGGGNGMMLNIFLLLPMLEASRASKYYAVSLLAHGLPPWILNINNHLLIKGRVLY